MKMKVKRVREGAVLSEYHMEMSAGFVFCACVADSVTLEPGEIRAFPTGIGVEIPRGYELQIRPRSGLSCKFGVTMINGVGTIDADFRGEIQVLMVNWGKEDFVVKPGMRIAQGVVSRCERVEWVGVETLSETERWRGGIGSTGLE